MSRRSRLKLDGIPIHIRKPGNNRNACFYADEDYPFYLESLDGYCHDEKVKARVGYVGASLQPTISQLIRLRWVSLYPPYLTYSMHISSKPHGNQFPC